MELDDFKWPAIRCYADVYGRLPIDNPFYFLFWAISFGAFLYVLKRLIVRRGSPRIQFFITDIWTGILSLLPAFALLRDAMDENREINWSVIGLFVVAFGSICGGIWVWLVLAMTPPDVPPPGRESHFVSVLSGGFAGLLGVVASGFAFALLPALYAMVRSIPIAVFEIVAAWFALCVAMPPLFLFTAAFVWFSKKVYDVLINP